MFRPIYEPRNRAREYCDLAVNIYTGCNHGCIYCYAPRVSRKTRAEFAKVSPRKYIAEAVKLQLRHDKIIGKKIMLCFTCDPYPKNIDTTVTRDVIKAIKDSGNYVCILTKGGLRARRDFDLLDEDDSFGVTISAYDSIDIEPNAAPPVTRIDTLIAASKRGIKTWVSCEPVYAPEDIFHLIREVDYIGLYRIGKLNYAHSDIDWGKFGRECERLCKKCGRDYYIKEDLRKCMDAGASI